MLSRDKRPKASSAHPSIPSSHRPTSTAVHPASSSSTFQPPFIQTRQYMSGSAASTASAGSALGTRGTSTGSGGPQQGGPNAGRWGDVRIVHPAWEGFGRGMAPGANAGTGGATGGGGSGGGVGKSKL
ncbi:uncharacterized protein MKK02DRAFT_43977 [Dioszegia hungarica]|uniref:Uncharacterized protein n=1 Tax=Dioszegia hungarica TaxID=4972 RepID=A0AA38LV57_9TREE|nr:uncharacterized protein MKK02DRAFT_43977 [Dioszegia hungarica]KAI9635294.1 hypothetical protein MKK02DRAFT_43977 [Dioszegia hungarica]